MIIQQNFFHTMICTSTPRYSFIQNNLSVFGFHSKIILIDNSNLVGGNVIPKGSWWDVFQCLVAFGWLIEGRILIVIGCGGCCRPLSTANGSVHVGMRQLP